MCVIYVCMYLYIYICVYSNVHEDACFPYVFLISTALSILSGSDSHPRFVEATWPKPTQPEPRARLQGTHCFPGSLPRFRLDPVRQLDLLSSIILREQQVLWAWLQSTIFEDLVCGN